MAEVRVPGPLGDLVAHIARQSPGVALQAETLQQVHRTWSRLRADQRLAESRSTLPENAGPLHSQQLVHRALAAMRELSPGYFEHFGAHVEALLWIESANRQHHDSAEPAPKKTGRGRRA